MAVNVVALTLGPLSKPVSGAWESWDSDNEIVDAKVKSGYIAPWSYSGEAIPTLATMNS